MNPDPKIWQSWAIFLKKWGVEEIALSFLKSSGALTIVGAQLIYISQPILDSILPRDHLSALAQLLEDRSQVESFDLFLHKETNS